MNKQKHLTKETLGRKLMIRRFLIVACTIALIALLAVSTAYAATLTIQTVTNKYKYNQGTTVLVRANAQNGSTRITSSNIYTATVTIKNPSGTAVVSGKAMSKDSYTGLCYYSYTLSSSAPKGTWTVTVTIKDKNGNSGTGTSAFKVQAVAPSHSTYFSTYEGTKTCITSACHATQANHVFNSVHYQWTGDPQKAIELNAAGSRASKLGGINNFCIWPDANWLTIFNKTDGTQGPGGCAVCHAGLGLKPSTTSSQAQLENIDCLICHAPNYKRIVVKNADGTFSLAPDPTIDIQSAAKAVTRPTRETCMRCHQNSGGGNNYKRGDLESTSISCDKNYDVHMGSTATGGQNFTCQDCHRTDSHKMAGRGIDMRALDSAFDLSCESCHSQIPHRSYNTNYSSLNRHSDKVNCTTCHIPYFAKTVATDMHRNWAVMELDAAKKLYDPEMTKQTSVMPKYAWFNGYSHFYKFKDKVALDSRGVQKLAWPDGGFVDIAGKPVAKLYPVKVHEGNSPINNAAGNAFDNVLLPVKNKIAFETGDVDSATVNGAAAAGITYNGHSFIKTEQYQGIFHTVGPKASALSCSNEVCHPQIAGSSTRIPFLQLGYERRGTNSQLCDVCHSLKSFPGFTKLHTEHSDRKNCSACHGSGYPLKEPKSTLCDNCHSYKSESDQNKIHSKHVQSKGYDCKNCHTFSGNPDEEGHSKDH